MLRGVGAPGRFATKVGFARTFGVSIIRANSIRAIAIMTKAVETNRIWAPLNCCDTFSLESFSSRIKSGEIDNTMTLVSKNRV